MEITEDLIKQAKTLIDPKSKTVSLVDLRKQFNLTFYASVDLRNELVKHGLAVMPKRAGKK